MIAVLLLSGCSGNKINVPLARNLIVGSPQAALQKSDLQILKISQPSGSEAIVETNLKAAFRIERTADHWVIREVRLGHGQWEKVSDLEEALARLKTEDTRRMLDLLANAILKYRDANGKMPTFNSYVTLTDLLSPKFLTPLIRLDSWQRPLEAESMDPDTILLRSVGPDGLSRSSDDILRTVHP
jgi:hypothetical protein